MIPKSGHGFRKRSCSTNKVERDDYSKKSHHARDAKRAAMDKMTQRLPMLIVGGGIGGLAAALALSRKGLRVELIEQAPQFKEIGAGIQLGPNVFHMFEILGLTEGMSALAVFPENLIM